MKSHNILRRNSNVLNLKRSPKLVMEMPIRLKYRNRRWNSNFRRTCSATLKIGS